MGTTHHISIPLELCYGSMAFFSTVLHNIFLLYHVDIFVSVYKIDKFSFWVGETIFLIWNSVNDPLFGWLSDKKYLKTSGRSHSSTEVVNARLSALKLNGPLLAISFLLFWFPWGYPAVQFTTCLCLYDGFLTMIDLHHSALLADLAVSAQARTRLNAKSSLFSAFGSASVFISYAVWNKSDLHSFRIFCMVLALVSFCGFWCCSELMKSTYANEQKVFSFADEVDHHERTNEVVVPDQQALKTFIFQLKKQQNFVWFAVMNLIQVFHCHFNSNFFPLFLENLLGDTVSPGFGSFLIGISFVAPHINNLYFLSLCQKYGVYKVIKLLFAIKLGISIVMYILGPSHIWMLCLFIASNRVFTEGTCKLLNLVISDLVDEDYVLNSRKKAVSALIFGTSALVSKPGQTLAPLIGTWLLSIQTGHDIFQTGNEMGSIRLDLDRMNPLDVSIHKQGCFNLLVYIPILCALVQLAVWAQFTLHGRRLRWVKSVRSGAEHSLI